MVIMNMIDRLFIELLKNIDKAIDILDHKADK